jgi:hypothetical protein
MTMHLQRGLSTLSTRKPTFKLTKRKRAEWEFDWMADNKLRKSQGMPKITFDEYCLNRLGKVKLDKPVFRHYRLARLLIHVMLIVWNIRASVS